MRCELTGHFTQHPTLHHKTNSAWAVEHHWKWLSCSKEQSEAFLSFEHKLISNKYKSIFSGCTEKKNTSMSGVFKAWACGPPPREHEGNCAITFVLIMFHSSMSADFNNKWEKNLYFMKFKKIIKQVVLHFFKNILNMFFW